MTHKIFLTVLSTCLGFCVSAQLQMKIKIDKDALLKTRVGNTTIANTNYGSSTVAHSNAWTNSGSAETQRYIFEADLSSLPSNIKIVSANLYLFGRGNHSVLSGSNASTLYELTNFEWTENGITWNIADNALYEGVAGNLPSTDASGTNIADLDYVVDISSVIESNFLEEKFQFPFLLKLNNESYYRRMGFHSSDYTDTTKVPYIEITYYKYESFALPKSRLDGAVHLIDKGILNIVFDEKYYTESGGALTLRFYDQSNNLVYSPTNIIKETGYKKYSIDLKNSGGSFASNQVYTCELEDEKGRVKYIRFRYEN